jgi:hypothetical protein
VVGADVGAGGAHAVAPRRLGHIERVVGRLLPVVEARSRQHGHAGTEGGPERRLARGLEVGLAELLQHARHEAHDVMFGQALEEHGELLPPVAPDGVGLAQAPAQEGRQ